MIKSKERRIDDSERSLRRMRKTYEGRNRYVLTIHYRGVDSVLPVRELNTSPSGIGCEFQAVATPSFGMMCRSKLLI